MKKEKVVEYGHFWGKDPTEGRLIRGKLYLVEEERKRAGFEKDYRLRGEEGWFNSEWFNHRESYVAISDKIPDKEKWCDFTMISLVGGVLKLEKTKPEAIMEIENLGNNVYLVKSPSKLYYVSVGYGGEY